MKGDYKENFKKSITELTSEFEPFIKESQIKENSINNKLQSFQEKLIEKVKGKCGDTYLWFENNRNTLNEENKNDPEVQKHLIALQKCTEGIESNILKEELVNTEKFMNKISSVQKTCTEECINEFKKNESIDLKRCLRPCFENTFKKADKIQERLNLKIDDAIKNLNKI